MPLTPGTSLGPYQIESPLGAGGMGRTVAIKVLPEHVAADPDLKARFEREAKTVAALSHPHICPVLLKFDPSIPSRLDKDVQHVAVLIHGSPQVLFPAIDRHEQLVEVPGVVVDVGEQDGVNYLVMEHRRQVATPPPPEAKSTRAIQVFDLRAAHCLAGR